MAPIIPNFTYVDLTVALFYIFLTNSIIRINPFRDLLDMRDSMNCMLERGFFGPSTFQSDWGLTLDVAQKYKNTGGNRFLRLN